MQLDLDYLVNYLDGVVGRKYSIADFGQKGKIWLLVKLVEVEVTESRLFRGLCSGDLVREGMRGKEGGGMGRRRGRLLPGEVRP